MVPSASTTRRRPAPRLPNPISKSLAKKAVAYALDGTVRDLSDPLGASGKVEIITRDDPRALELIRHDAAHVLAEAVQELWPGTQVTIGPVIENGFYYDFARNEPFTPDDFPAIEKKMREIIAPQPAVHQGGLGPRDKRQEGLPRQGRELQGRADRRHSRRPGSEDLCAGRLVRPLPRPAHGLDRPDRQCLQADEGGRRLLARRQQQPDADAHLRHGLGRSGAARCLSPHAGGSREARPSPARPRDGPVPFPGGGAGRRVLARQGLEDVPAPGQLHAPPPRRAGLSGGQRAAGARQERCGRRRATGAGTATTCSR